MISSKQVVISNDDGSFAVKKLTNKAVGVAVMNTYNNEHRLLILWRKKWESEGTPLILPGGEVENEETFELTARLELAKGAGIYPYDVSEMKTMFTIETEWSKQLTLFYCTCSFDDLPIMDGRPSTEDTKFAGHIWVPVDNKSLLVGLLPLCMPALRKFILEHLLVTNPIHRQ